MSNTFLRVVGEGFVDMRKDLFTFCFPSQHGKNGFLLTIMFFLSSNSIHCNENPIYVFLFWELRGFSPNFHIRVSVSDLVYIPRIGPHISCSKTGNIWEYIFPILGIGPLQCTGAYN
jgi:hypothetical protein